MPFDGSRNVYKLRRLHPESLFVYGFCDLLNRCKMPARTVKALHAKLSPFSAKNWLPWQSPFTQVQQILSSRNFFIHGVSATIRVEIRTSVVETNWQQLKKENRR